MGVASVVKPTKTTLVTTGIMAYLNFRTSRRDTTEISWFKNR